MAWLAGNARDPLVKALADSFSPESSEDAPGSTQGVSGSQSMSETMNASRRPQDDAGTVARDIQRQHDTKGRSAKADQVDQGITPETPWGIGKNHKGTPLQDLPDEYLEWAKDGLNNKTWRNAAITELKRRAALKRKSAEEDSTRPLSEMPPIEEEDELPF
jgi:hypothetical protein